MILVVQGQNLIDIAIQESGSTLSAFDWALANNISMSSILIAGGALKQIDSVSKNIDVTHYFQNRKQLIATDYDIAVLQPIGIGTMAIETTFIIN